MVKYAWEILKGLYVKIGWVSYYFRLEVLINTHLSNSLKEYYIKYKAATE
jgi:hypothetical protein